MTANANMKAFWPPTVSVSLSLRLMALELAVALLLTVGSGACGGSQPGRPTLPPPEYEEPLSPSAPSAASASPTAERAPSDGP